MAAKDIVAELAVNLTLDTAAFASGASAAEARAKTLEGRMGALGGRAKAVGGALTGLAGGFIAGFGVSTITGAIASGLEYASSLGEVAEQLGVTTDELQQYRYAASQTGISNDEMDAGLARLTRTVGDAASGVGAAQAPFEKLGINIRDANGNIKSAGALMPELAEALARIPDPAERAAIMTDLFGKSGQKLAPLLSGGAKGVNDLRKAADELNLVITPEQIKRADEAADKWAAYKQVIGSQIAVGAVTGLDGLTAFNAFMDRTAKGAHDALASIDKDFADYGAKVAANIQSFKDTLGNGAAAAAGFAARVGEGIGALKGVFASLASSALSSMASMAGGIRDHLVSRLEGVWAKVKEKANQAGNDFFRLYDRVVGHSYIPDMVDEVGGHVARLDGVMVKPIVAATDSAAAAFAGLGEQASGVFGASGAANDNLALGAAVDAFEVPLLSFGEEVKRTTGEVIEGFGQMAARSIGSVKDMVATFKSGDILGGIQQFLETVLSVAQALGKLGVIKTAPAAGTYAGARAAGGPVVPGKSYLVGENGPEFITPRRSGFVHPNGSGGQQRIQIVPSPYFNAVVDHRASSVAAPMAGQAAVMGAAGAEARSFRRARRSIP